jgi:hypothetical protein
VRRAAAVLAAVLPPLAVLLALTTASPAHAAPAAAVVHDTPAGTILYTQHTPAGYYMNFWGGGDLIKSYGAVTYNDGMEIQWIGHNQFQIADQVHPGSCVGDYGNDPNDDRAAGGNQCPSTGAGGWGTIFTQSSEGCPAGYFIYRSNHWGGGIYVTDDNGDVVIFNSGGGDCLTQSD